jgi:3-deoxy-7-phosphoheptulonate synthase
MIVEMVQGASEEQVQVVVARAQSYGFGVQLNRGTDKVVVAILGGDTSRVSTDVFAVLDGVESVTRIMRPYKLASREFKDTASVVQVGDVAVGGPRLVMIAGPCAIESREQLQQTAEHVLSMGARIVRGGAFKPRTSPFSFQGMGEEGLQLLGGLRQSLHAPVTSEIIDPHQVDLMLDAIDMFQVGARNMQNYSLLRAVGLSGKPCLLKRGLAATVKEWLQAADYLLSSGGQVILCERGIRTFEDSTRFTLDLSSVAVVKHNSHLPIIVDPSHAAGHHLLVPSLARAAIAAGADGLIIEVHPDPKSALSDSLQSLSFPAFDALMHELTAIAQAMGRSF